MTSLLGRLRTTNKSRWWTTFTLTAVVAGVWGLTTPLFAAPDVRVVRIEHRADVYRPR